MRGVSIRVEQTKGYVLPIERWSAAFKHPLRTLAQRTLEIRRGHLFLFPGDSPLGLRLPIASLEYVPPRNFLLVEQDPMSRATRDHFSDTDTRTEGAKTKEKAKPEPVRTALSIETRDGTLSPSCRRSRRSKTTSN